MRGRYFQRNRESGIVEITYQTLIRSTNRKYFQTPLFTLTKYQKPNETYKTPFQKKHIQKYNKIKNNKENKLYLIPILTNSDRVAKTKSIFNKHRSDIIDYLKTISKHQRQRYFELVLHPLCQFVPSSEIVFQLKNSIKETTITNKKIQKLEKIQPINYQTIYSSLFPFNKQIWENQVLKKQFINTYYGYRSQMYDSSHIFVISHFYICNFSKNLQHFRDDVKDFIQFLRKFNYFNFIKDISNRNYQKVLTYSRRFIRSLEYRTTQSQYYLVFISQNLRIHDDHFEILESLEKIANLIIQKRRILSQNNQQV